jgi:hypothetical protein
VAVSDPSGAVARSVVRRYGVAAAGAGLIDYPGVLGSWPVCLRHTCATAIVR